MSHTALLIADDEEAICFALARQARRHQITPLVASDGEQAVALARGCGSELVAGILDVRMPRRDGVSAALLLREERPSIALALMTAFPECPLPPALGALIRLFQKPFELEAFSDWLDLIAGRCAPTVTGVPPHRAGAA